MQIVTKRGVYWLAAAAEEPQVCRSAWEDDPRRPYLLPTGRFFDVVVVGQQVGMEAYDQLDRRGLPLGPVLADLWVQRVGFLLPVGSRDLFTQVLAAECTDTPQYRYLGPGSYVVVPGPVTLNGDRHQWLRTPVRAPGDNPEHTAALAVAFAAAASLVERLERYGEQRQPAALVPSAHWPAGR